MLLLRPAGFASFAIRIPSHPTVLCTLKIAAMVLVSMFFACPSALAYQLTLEWDSNVEQDLGGYIVYYGTSSRNYKYDVDVGDESSCTISNLYSGVTYYFAVTAYDFDGNESAYSAEITYPDSVYAGSGGGGGGGCFISAAANEEGLTSRSLTLSVLTLASLLGALTCLRKRCANPAKNLP